jgi:hypothetical protein
MYDAAQMQSLAAAEASVTSSSEAAAIVETLANSVPNFHLPSSITVRPNQIFVLDVIVTDPDGDDVTLTVSSSPEISETVSLVGRKLVWQVASGLNRRVNLTVTATDSKGAASEWRPVILLCHCVKGTCSFEYAMRDAAGGE